jgi:hypothetical protein
MIGEDCPERASIGLGVQTTVMASATPADSNLTR